MKKIILTYGVISGSILGALLISTMSLYQHEMLSLDYGELLGYSTIVIALSLIFFGIKSLRDNHLGGTITFWKGCQTGLLITLVAGIMYALAWEISYSNIGDDFNKKMQERYLDNIEKKGLSPEAIQAEKEKTLEYLEYYKNPLIRFGVTLTEILPVGIIITLLSAGLLRKKELLPSTTN